MIEHLYYNIHNFDTFIDEIYEKFITDVTDVNMLNDNIVFNSTLKRFLQSATLEVLIGRSYIDMRTSATNVIAICDSEWVEGVHKYVDSKEFVKNIIQYVDNIKRVFPILIKRFNCTFNDVKPFLKSTDGMMVTFELNTDHQKLKSGMSFKKLKKNMIDNGLRYVYNEVLTDTVANKLLVL